MKLEKNYNVKLCSKVVEKKIKNREKMKDKENMTIFNVCQCRFNLELKSKQIKVTCILYALTTNDRIF